MRTLIITWLSILVSFALISTPAIANDCDDRRIVEICQDKVDHFDDLGCALDESCLDYCIAREVVCMEKGKHGKVPPACEQIKKRWQNMCQYDEDGEKCEGPNFPPPCEK